MGVLCATVVDVDEVGVVGATFVDVDEVVVIFWVDVVISGVLRNSTSDSEFKYTINDDPTTSVITNIKMYLLFIFAFNFYEKTNN